MGKNKKNAQINSAIIESQNNDLTPQTENVCQKKLVVYLPENLDLAKSLEENPPKEMPLRNINHVKDNMAQILHVITYLPSVKKDFDYEGNKGFVPLNRQKLQKSGIHDYNVYLDYLLDRGIILVDPRYVKGTLSKGIKFSNQYAFSKIKKSFITKKSLVKVAIKKSKEANNLMQQEYPYLYSCWISDKLSFDHRAAQRYLESKLNKDKDAFLEKYNMIEIEYYEEQLRRDSRKKEKIKYPTKQYNSNYLLMDRLHRQEYFWKIDKKAGRLHTILTQMSKDLRKFVSYGGQKLVGIDLRNSQPLLATALLDKDIFNNNPILMDKIKERNSYHRRGSLVNLIENKQKEKDVLMYKKIVAQGKFYEEFGDILQQNGLIPETVKDVRKFAKEATFSAFFASNFDIRYIPAMQHFKETFPNVYDIFSEIKYAVKGTKKNDKVHNALSVSLQALEAEIFLNRICKRISETNPHIPIFTIHDSVVTTIEHKATVKRIVEEEIYKVLKIRPVLNIEYWT